MFAFQTTRQPEDGMIDYFETKSQPITKAMVLKAYGYVRAKKGGAGVDGMTRAELDSNLQGYLYKLRNRLSSGSYYPQPVLQVEIPKKSGGV
jgi:retron-type reverse transcriptase